MKVYPLSALDALPVLKQTFDAMITDPPYMPRVHKKVITQIARGGQARDLEFGHLTAELRTAIATFAGARVRKWSLIYSDLQGTHDWRVACQAAGLEHVRDVPWVRWSMPQLSADRPPSGAEMIQWFHPKGKKVWHGPGNLIQLDHSDLDAIGEWIMTWERDNGSASCPSGVLSIVRDALSIFPALDHACLRKSNKHFHPTEKPLKQALDLVRWTTEPGDHVFDPCAGAATIGVACRYLGREFSGLEARPDWAEQAQARLDTETELDARHFREWVAEYDQKYAVKYDRGKHPNYQEKAK